MAIEELMQGQWVDDSMRAGRPDGKVPAFFHTVQVLMQKKTADAGRPIFEERIFITKITPGDKGQVIDRRIRQDEKTNDTEDYPVEWARFQAKQDQRVIGFPIENWQALSDTQKAEFKAMKISTVEQFANLSDSQLQNIGMGSNNLRDKARAFVASGKDAEIIGKIRAEAAEREAGLNAQMEKQAAEMAELRAMLEKLTAPTNAKPEKVHA